MGENNKEQGQRRWLNQTEELALVKLQKKKIATLKIVLAELVWIIFQLIVQVMLIKVIVNTLMLHGWKKIAKSLVISAELLVRIKSQPIVQVGLVKVIVNTLMLHTWKLIAK